MVLLTTSDVWQAVCGAVMAAAGVLECSELGAGAAVSRHLMVRVALSVAAALSSPAASRQGEAAVDLVSIFL